jgi:ubiquinol-cytochrome c reductase iron-sulfur subunit
MSDSHDGRKPGRARVGAALGLIVALRTIWAALRRRRTVAPDPAPSDPGAPDVVAPAATECDPSQRTVPASRQAETAVAVLLLLTALFALAFVAAYVLAGTNTQLLGAALAGALAMLAVALILAGKLIVPQETSVEDRGPLLEEREVEEVTEMLEAGGEGISRRLLLTGAGGVAGAALLTAAATPLASLGPTLEGIHQTPWRRGVRLVDDEGRPYLASEIQVGSFYTALPEHSDPQSFGAGLVVVRLPPDQIHLPADRQTWAPQGILAYSKICPHAGCAISLYRYPTFEPTSAGPAFTCPCHYSSFSPGEGGRLIFGPAGRALPQLPLQIDAEDHLSAGGPFDEDIGPSWWSVRRPPS